jgi:anti-sigma-K factor RskA
MMTQHPSDETLNEYLDNALDAPARANVDAHLAGCSQCTAQLEMWRALFSELDTLTEEPLARDLSAGVLARLPLVQPRVQPTLTWLFVIQALAAVLVLALVTPFTLSLLTSAAALELSAQAQQAGLDFLASLNTDGQSLGAAIDAGLQQILANVAALSAPLAETSLLGVGVALAAAFVLWVLGNGALLRVTAFTGSRSWKN